MAIFNTVYGGEPNWKPNDNTVIYFPFKDDALDHSWNWIVLSNTWTSQSLWYQFTSASSYSQTLTNLVFVSYYIKVVSNVWQNSYCQVCTTRKWTMWYNVNHNDSSFRNCVQFGTSSWTWYKETTGIVSWSWYHLAYWYDGSQAVMYVNWVKKVMYTGSSYRDQDAPRLTSDSWYTLILSEVIWESRCWTSDEVLLYYNRTKDNYS